MTDQKADQENTRFDAPLPNGTVVSHYRIIEHVGAGGMGEVYLADDTALNRPVALKFLSGTLNSDSSMRSRFTREVQAVAALNHPNIIHVYEVSEYESRPFFAMEYVEGEALRDLIHRGPIPIDQVLSIALSIGEGLNAAHQVSIVHRDIKPANIVLDRSGRVKILDFGLAKRITDPSLTSLGSTLGTVWYMSPEQAQGRESDHRSDIFSYGVVLYEMITGKRPFRGDYDAATLTAIVKEDPEPLSRLRPDAPRELQPIMDRLLAKDLGHRYQQLSTVLPELAAVRDQLRLGSGQSRRAGGRAKAKIAAFAGAVVVIAGLLIVFSRFRGSRATSEVPTVRGEGAGSVATAAIVRGPHSKEKALTSPEGHRDSVVAKMTPPLRPRDSSFAQGSEARREVLDKSGSHPAPKDTPPVIAARPASGGVHEERQVGSVTPSFEMQSNASGSVGNAPQAGNVRASSSSEEPRADSRRQDSLEIRSIIDRFWQALEERHLGALREMFPRIGPEREKMWHRFVKNTTDLQVASAIEHLDMGMNVADATVSVNMAYKDSRGAEKQTVRYDLRLRRDGAQWIIVNMDQNR